jgi:ATP-dependent Clp protease ATP-binding subunit ClpA
MSNKKKGFNELLLPHIISFEKLSKEEQHEIMEKTIKKIKKFLKERDDEYREEQRLLRLRKNKRYTL